MLAALGFMNAAVIYSHRAWDPETGVPRDAFAWGPESKDASLYEVVFLEGGVRYQYGFVVNDEAFLEEWLFAWPHGRKQVWFERDGDEFKFGDSLHGENKLVERTTRPNALFLSTAIQHRHEQLRPVYHWFRRTEFVNAGRGYPSLARPGPEFWLARMMERRPDPRQTTLFSDVGREDDGELGAFLRLLRAADVGITDIRIEADPEAEDSRRGSRRKRVWLRHQSTHAEAWLPLHEESHGTQTLFRLAFPIINALRRGGALVVDELEAGLHPLLAAHVVELFNRPESNPRNAQILFTTHDTNLLGTTLGEPLLRRDQIWLTEKDADGATSR